MVGPEWHRRFSDGKTRVAIAVGTHYTTPHLSAYGASANSTSTDRQLRNIQYDINPGNAARPFDALRKPSVGRQLKLRHFGNGYAQPTRQLASKQTS
ncbi:hypothetical protein RB195_022202 [Necator americanus]|uniref:Uncharacterized protein n=1 Tax=Necator americanus TaxID=51031 RepID=A0ABR1EEC2_NECAM